MERLPEEHSEVACRVCAALCGSGDAVGYVDGVVPSEQLYRLGMEQILCFGTALDAEKFCNEKSAIFIVLPEEDQSKYFMVSLIIQQLYREILVIADENGGKLDNRVYVLCR